MKAADTNPTALGVLNAKRPLVIGHRGYSSRAPENTLPSFRLAMDAGVDLVELDYHHSKDGIPVAIHDAILDRTTDARKRWGRNRIPVAAKTAAEIQSLDAGSWFDAKFAGTGIPLLSEALDVICAESVALIEHKAGDAATCVKLLRETNRINRVIIISFDWDFLRDVHELAPQQVLGALGPPNLHKNAKRLFAQTATFDASTLDEVERLGANLLVWNRRVTKRSLRLAHERGVRVFVYTIDEPNLALRLVDMGVDGIISNKPASVASALASR